MEARIDLGFGSPLWTAYCGLIEEGSNSGNKTRETFPLHDILYKKGTLVLF
jgi:hypothetical protein